ncbi:MAG: chalcone isomerase family protein [Pseudomonadota bacterium]
MNALMVARMIKASRTAVVVAIMLLLSSATFHAHAFRDDVTDVINQYVPDAELVGECRVNYLFFKIYDAALFAPAGDWETGKPFALTLSYLRDIPGDVIVARTLTEMRKQGFSDETALGRWREQLSHIIPDVSRETTLTGIADEQGHTVFLTGNEEIGRVQDPAFTEQFFAIWMGANSSRPDLRDQLLGRPG